MTIGPDPITATERMSARLGNCGSIRRGDPVDERGQRLAGVVRPGAGLGVELERGHVAVAQDSEGQGLLEIPGWREADWEALFSYADRIRVASGDGIGSCHRPIPGCTRAMRGWRTVQTGERI